MFGNATLALWGTSQWGAITPEPGAVFAADAVCSGDLDRLVSLDALAALIDQEGDVALDAIVLGELEAAFALDAAPALLPPEVYAKLTTSPYVLVELQFAGGTIRVSNKHRSALSATWGARLIKSGRILRTIGRGTDDLRLELDDTDTNGAARFRDLFALDDPEGSLVKVWIGAAGAKDSEHQLVFEGKIQQVQGFSETAVRLSVIRREQVEDVLLGQLVDEVTFPNAPPESISTMLPIVFGQLEAHEGVVIDTLETGTLRFNVFAADTTLDLVDASEFPGAGTVRINAEQASYIGKTGDTLTGVTRGVNATNPSDHPRGSEVAEVGIFQVKYASHELGVMRTFKMQLPNGNLGDPVPQPTTVDPASALATWANGLPQIRDPDARPTYQRVHFRDPDALNTALNPQFAARENIGYEAFKVAQVSPGGINALVLLTNTDKLSEAGDIQRIWLGVLFDPKITVAFAQAATALFTLVPFDVVPEEIARNDERTGDRIYDVPPPVIGVTAQALVDFSATPQNVEEPGIFVTVARASNAVDKNDDTFACFMFVGLGESLIAGGGDVVAKWTQQEWEAAFPLGSANVSMEIRALMGDTIFPFTSPWEVYIRLDGKELVGTRLLCSSLNPAGLPAGFIRGIEEFKLTIGGIDPFLAGIPDGAGGTIEAWDRYDMVLHPITGVSAGIWCAREVSIQGQNEPPLPVIDATQDVRNSVTNYLEVTPFLPTTNGRIDWSVFADPNLLGRAIFTSNALEELLVIETFWVVEFTPFVSASSKVPRSFANVSGLVPDGRPTEIARALITGAAPEGMGLATDRIDNASYLAAETSQSADGVRLDFALRAQSGAVPLLSDVATQSDARDTWENQVHRIVRLPRADQAVPVARSLLKGDVLFAGGGVRNKSISRSSMRGVANRITARYRLYAPSGETSRTFELNDAPSQASKIGLQEGVLELGLVQDDTAANVVAQRKLERVRVPRWIVQLDVPIYGISYRAGDLVTLSTPDFSFQVGEITQVNLSTDRLKRVGLEVVVWNK